MRPGVAALLVAFGLESAVLARAAVPPPASQVDPYVARPRVLVLTDIANEPDDQMSLVRFLVYSNQFDVEGLVATTSTWMKDKVRPDVILTVLDAYEQVQPNLLKHAAGFPAAAALRGVVASGQPGYGMAAVGRGKTSPGAGLIVKAALASDPRPLWVLAWGGTNTLAQALVRREGHADAARTRGDRREAARLHDLRPGRRRALAPPGVPGAALRRHALDAGRPGVLSATWTGISGDRFYKNAPGADFTTFTDEWVNENVRAKGPLGKHYPYPCCIHEGDTPSFLALIDNGLASAMSPAFGGWGGRYVWRQPSGETRPFWTQGGDSYPGRDSSRDTVTVEGRAYTSDQATIWRWRRAFQNDFAARMDWTIKDKSEANHNPLVVVNGRPGTEPLVIDAEVGTSVTLDAAGTRDPDGHGLSLDWFFYPEAGSGIPGSRCSHAPRPASPPARRPARAVSPPPRPAGRASPGEGGRREPARPGAPRGAEGRRHRARHPRRRRRRHAEPHVLSPRDPEHQAGRTGPPHTMTSPMQPTATTSHDGRTLADQAFSRAAGAPLVTGNAVRLLCDAAENYPAWLEAIAAARRATSTSRCYIIHEDAVGERFAERVRGEGSRGRRGAGPLRLAGRPRATPRAPSGDGCAQAGVEVRCYNPPRLDEPLGWLSRDHRKCVVVDGEVAFVTGLCVGRMWEGDPARASQPGATPASSCAARPWRRWSAPSPTPGQPAARRCREDAAGRRRARAQGRRRAARRRRHAGHHRALPGRPARGGARAPHASGSPTPTTRARAPTCRRCGRRRGTASTCGCWCRARSDIPVMQPISRAGYRPLLEAGVRVFEWNGPMLHAKTAVADGRWARVGSTNLNIASWIGNRELDVIVEDDGFARAMEEQYLKDLAGSTEVVLSRRRVRPAGDVKTPRIRGGGGSASRAAAGALRLGNAVGAALSPRKLHKSAPRPVLVSAGLVLVALALVGAFWPQALAWPLGALALWLGLVLLLRAARASSAKTP